MESLLAHITKEWSVLKGAPATFLVCCILTFGLTWTGATAFYKQEVAGAKQEHATAVAERDFFKDRLELQVKAVPAANSPGAVSTKAPAPIFRNGGSSVHVVKQTPPTANPQGNTITSYFQTGGINGVVNVGPQPRVLVDDVKRQLIENIPKDRPVRITALLGDGEAIAFASDIFSFLKANGFKMAESGISQSVFSGPVNGTHVDIGDDKISITVGANLPERS